MPRTKQNRPHLYKPEAPALSTFRWRKPYGKYSATGYNRNITIGLPVKILNNFDRFFLFTGSPA